MSSQWIRKCSLILAGGGQALDLSEMHITFRVRNADQATPNTAEIRVLNLGQEEMARVSTKREFSEVVLAAGYQQGSFGNIFLGTIRQVRTGRLTDGVTTYMDILASDGDVFHNFTTINKSIEAGATPAMVMGMLAKEAPGTLLELASPLVTQANVPAIRGQVQFGMARARMRNLVTHLDAAWSSQAGKITVTPNDGYRDGTAVVISRDTGMVGVPEQMDGGINVCCLLNPRIRIGGRVQLANEEINQLFEVAGEAPVAYNAYATYNNAPLAGNGLYRAFSVEHEGDTRGNAWYSTLVCLALDPTKGAA